TGDDVRVELTPMIDVVFLLLTFFVFSIVLMIRADVLDVNLPDLTAGQNAERVTPITITVREDGGIFLNSEETTVGDAIVQAGALRAESPDSPILLAVDVQSEVGVLVELMDALVAADLRDFSIVGRRSEDTEAADSEPETGESP
ncbi:MAG: biopolymer transporter ExbD, partial [bacterium]|nr:biopolymer transporter ExbD [bacterium]